MSNEPYIEEAPPEVWTDALDRADADVAAGRVFDGSAVRQRLRDSAKRMQADAEVKAARGG